jgi:murein DD-endopeptidase MepM/ murein hydrolase activator NlpD
LTAKHDRRSYRRFHHLPGGARWLRILLAACLLASTMSVQAPPSPARADDLSDAVAEQMKLDKLIADQQKKLAVISTQQSKLQSQIAATQKNLDELNTTVDSLQADIVILQIQVDQVQLSYGELAAQEEALQAQFDELEARRKEKQEQLEQRQAILARRLVAAYKADQTPLLAQILGAGSLSDALSDISYLMELGTQDAALAQEIIANREALVRMETQVSIARSAVSSLADQVERQGAMLDSQMGDLNAAREKLLVTQRQLDAQIAQQQAANDKLAKDKAAMAAAIKANGEASAKLADKITQLAADQGYKDRIPSQYSGRLTWPMGGRVSQEYGCTGFWMEPRVGSCAHFHQGIDLVAPCLTPVHAAGSGVVLFVGYNPYDAPPKAWLVIIAHAENLVTWYAHMTGKAPTGIFVGAQVSSGQLIGTENTTGHSTGCHLHWAVLSDGVFKNPRLFL